MIHVKRRDVLRLAPKSRPVPADSSGKSLSRKITQDSLFRSARRTSQDFPRIRQWAETFHPPSPEPLTLHPSAVQSYRACRALPLLVFVVFAGRPQGTADLWRVMHGTIGA